MKHTTLCNEYKNGGPKNVVIYPNITSLQYSWVKSLYDDNFHASKVMPLFIIKLKIFLLHSNLSRKQKIAKKFPKFSEEILARWGSFLSCPPKVSSAVASKFIRYNEYLKSDNNTIYYRYFFQKSLNHIDDFFKNNVKMKNWKDFRAKLDLDDNKNFYWRQIVHAISRAWKEMFLECGNNISNLIINEHHLI